MNNNNSNYVSWILATYQVLFFTSLLMLTTASTFVIIPLSVVEEITLSLQRNSSKKKSVKVFVPAQVKDNKAGKILCPGCYTGHIKA